MVEDAYTPTPVVVVGESAPLMSSHACPNALPALPAIPNDDVATKSYPPSAFPKSTWPYDGAVEVPVPPFEMPKIPDMSVARFTKPVETVPAVARNTPVKLPMESVPAERTVVEAMAAERLVVDALPNVWSAVNTLLVNVLGIVEEAATKELTELLKSEICDAMSETFGSAVMLDTELVAAKFVTKLLVARAGVK